MVCLCCGEEGWGFLFSPAPLTNYQNLVLVSRQSQVLSMRTWLGREHNLKKILSNQGRKTVMLVYKSRNNRKHW